MLDKDFDEGKKRIADILLQQPKSRYNLDKSYIYMRCIFCGDSAADRNAASLNIKVPDKDNPRWLYNCFRSGCSSHGYITSEFLRLLDYNNHETNVYLKRINKSSKKNVRFNEKRKRYIVNFPNPNTKLSIAKLNYINKRLGTNISLNELNSLKIHTALKELYEYNEIKPPVKKQLFYSKLSDYGLAFISVYNDYLIVRNVTKNREINRYTIVDIEEDDTVLDKFKFYTIPFKLNLLSSAPAVINMAEGAFDILSIYYNLDIDRDKKYDNQIFLSVSGSSYKKVLIHFIRQYGLVDCIINIFSDKDINIDTYKKLNKEIKKYTNYLEMTIYYNKMDNEKDFGVPLANIKLQKNIIY